MTNLSSAQNDSVLNWSATVSNEQQPKTPYRLGIALCAGVLLWLGPYIGTATVLLPARVAIIDPANKANIVAMLSVSAMIVATIANILIGAFSDVTRSRFGRRTPWLIIGSAGSAAMLLIMGRTESVTLLLIEWCVFQVFLNAIVAPLLAVISDRIAPAHRGTISSIYAFGFTMGIFGGQFINAPFSGRPDDRVHLHGHTHPSVRADCGPDHERELQQGNAEALLQPRHDPGQFQCSPPGCT
ncbi:MFS transporter [uncultured Martelella sp.]|uniref:MFS transporter n=1 Tax=uncultured Martelella sp. TaxID=392331 RepID=UPI0029C89AFD|nr:MFS transporter [uncultured Martelella sp.]